MKKILAILLALCFSLSSTLCLAENAWECPKCHNQNTGKFCGECGTAKPEWVCPECEQKNETKFCTGCGLSGSLAENVNAIKNGDYAKGYALLGELSNPVAVKWFARSYCDMGSKLVSEGKLEDALDTLKGGKETIEAHRGEMDSDPEEALKELSIGQIYCHYMLAVQSEQAYDLEAAYDHYDKACTALLDFQNDTPAAILQKVKDFGGHTLAELESFESWNDFYYQYAYWLLNCGIYWDAVNWFERCGDFKDSAEKRAQALEKEELQNQYREWFEVRPMFDVENEEEGFTVYSFEEDFRAYAGDYAPCVLYPGMELKNNYEDTPISITCKYKGEKYHWDQESKTFIGKDATSFFRIADALTPGVHYCAWYNNDVLIAYEAYDVGEGTSDVKGTVTEELTCETDLVLWDDEKDEVIQSGLQSGKMKADQEKHVYAPRIELTNHSSDEMEVKVCLIINGECAVSWKLRTLAEDETHGFVYSGVEEHVIGENNCIWYVNGVEVLRSTYTITE